jgi:thiamine transport system permease protein
LYIAAVLVLIIGPLSAVAISSFHERAASGGEIMLGNYRSVFLREGDPTIGASPLGAIENSLLFAFIATCVTVPLSMIGAYLMDSPMFRGKYILDVLILFPLGSSAIALGYGLASGDPGAMLSGTWAIIVLVHVLLAYPFCIRTIAATKREMDPMTIRSASLMGASRPRIFKDIELPVLLPGIAVAAAFSFAISIGELGATYMVFSPEYATMPVALYQFISGGRDIGAVAAYSVLLMIVAGASILIVDHAVRYLGRLLRWL